MTVMSLILEVDSAKETEAPFIHRCNYNNDLERRTLTMCYHAV